MLSSTTFHLQTAKTSSRHRESTAEELKAELAVRLAQKTTMTLEETIAYDAIQACMIEESYKAAAGSHKRSRKDDDPDQNSKSKKHKTTTGPSSLGKEPATTSTKMATHQQTHGSGSATHDEEEPLTHMDADYQEQAEPIPEFTIPESRPAPSSTSKPKKKSQSKKNKAEESMKSMKDIQVNVISWIDNDETPEVAWFDEMIKAQPPLPDDEEPLPGNTFQYT